MATAPSSPRDVRPGPRPVAPAGATSPSFPDMQPEAISYWLEGVWIAAAAVVVGALAAFWRAAHPGQFGWLLPACLLAGGLLQTTLSYLVPHLVRSRRHISGPKGVDVALRRSEERYRALVLASAQVVWTTPPDGLVDDMPMWRDYTGQTLEQVRGWGWLNAIHPDDRERTAAIWKNAVATGGLYETEYRVRRADGQYRHFSIRGVPVLEDDGSIREWVGICTDIHEHKQIEDELHKQAALLNLAHDAILVRDLARKIVYWNQGAEETYGWSAKEAAGRAVHELLRTESATPLPSVEAAVQEQGEWEGELQHVTRDGKTIIVASRWSLQRDHHGVPRNILEINRDITERKQLEDSLRQRTRELENSVAELEAFSYSVSHDLRAPLRSIDGFSQILLEDYRDKVDAEGQDCLRRIRKASQNMGQLIDALLQLSRVMRADLVREPVNLSVLALSTAAVVQKAAPGRKVQFHIANGLVARGDRRLLGVVLQNLLQNAWKFTARNPEPLIEFGSTQKEGKTAYYVRDNGIGFDMAYVDKLFTPFERLHAKEQFEGTGIGLATVQRIVKRHGGRVWAEGALGKGATFYFSLD
jgi:PAS domain S-box-containing protein